MRVEKKNLCKLKKVKNLVKVINAYCNSERCAGQSINFGVIKNVPRGTDWCPDCKSAIFWGDAPKNGKSEGSRRNKRGKCGKESEGTF